MNGYEVLTSYMWPWDFSHPGQNPRKSNPEDDQQVYWNIFKLIHPYAGPTSYMWLWVFHLPALNHGNLNSGADQQGNLVEYLRLHTRFYRAYVTLVALPIRRKSSLRAYQQGNMLEQFQFQIVFKGLAAYMWPWVFNRPGPSPRKGNSEADQQEICQNIANSYTLTPGPMHKEQIDHMQSRPAHPFQAECVQFQPNAPDQADCDQSRLWLRSIQDRLCPIQDVCVPLNSIASH